MTAETFRPLPAERDAQLEHSMRAQEQLAENVQIEMRLKRAAEARATEAEADRDTAVHLLEQERKKAAQAREDAGTLLEMANQESERAAVERDAALERVRELEHTLRSLWPSCRHGL